MQCTGILLVHENNTWQNSTVNEGFESVGRGCLDLARGIKILATTSPWPAPARVHPNIALFCGAHAGSTKVLAKKDSARHLLCTPASPLRGLHGTQAAAASRVLLLLDDGGGRGGAGHRLIALRAPGFCRCLHGAAAGMGVSATEMGDVV